MPVTRGRADHKMSGNEVMHNSNSNFAAFQVESLFTRMLLKMNILFKNIAQLSFSHADPCAVVADNLVGK